MKKPINPLVHDIIEVNAIVTYDMKSPDLEQMMTLSPALRNSLANA